MREVRQLLRMTHMHRNV